MENFKIESRYLKRVQGCDWMYEGCFLQTSLSKTIVSFDQNTRPSICFKTSDRALEREN